ncbi:MAG TPA: sulfotransferase family protein [Acidimicrobiales bacterium]|nr:sulfotransferase family protein [Acidimicrobiales bacterium]
MSLMTLAARVGAAANDEAWVYHSRVSTRHRYVAVAVPKVGCTSIKRALHELEGLPRTERLALDHDAGEQMRLARFAANDIAQMFSATDWLKFTFVRNPYDRMLSAWKSKILARHDTQYAPLRQRIRDELHYPRKQDEVDPPVVAFGDFVRFVASCADRAVTGDGHWERQIVVGRHDLIPYDVIGRFESFEADFRAVLERLGAPADVVAMAKEVTNSTEPLPTAAAYDTDLAAIVYDHYRDDFEAFGYERDSWVMRR